MMSLPTTRPSKTLSFRPLTSFHQLSFHRIAWPGSGNWRSFMNQEKSLRRRQRVTSTSIVLFVRPPSSTTVFGRVFHSYRGRTMLMAFTSREMDQRLAISTTPTMILLISASMNSLITTWTEGISRRIIRSDGSFTVLPTAFGCEREIGIWAETKLCSMELPSHRSSMHHLRGSLSEKWRRIWLKKLRLQVTCISRPESWRAAVSPGVWLLNFTQRPSITRSWRTCTDVWHLWWNLRSHLSTQATSWNCHHLSVGFIGSGSTEEPPTSSWGPNSFIVRARL
mmetsp:Transcript_4677/g.13240  ORF Transcript_4677/g.13240 Transcript_4677/m.13240 type:complete len:281 (+) Transcript_4677:1407-2249(+)